MGHKCYFHNQRAYEQRRNYVACESAVRYERWNMANQKRQGKSRLIRASVDALSRDGTDMRGDAQNPKSFQAPRM